MAHARQTKQSKTWAKVASLARADLLRRARRLEELNPEDLHLFVEAARELYFLERAIATEEESCRIGY